MTSISVSGDILDKQWGKLRGQQVDSGDCAGRLDAMAAGGIRAMSGSAGWRDTGPGCVDARSRSAVRDLGRPCGSDAIPGAGSFTPQAASPGGLPAGVIFPPTLAASSPPRVLVNRTCAHRSRDHQTLGPTSWELGVT